MHLSTPLNIHVVDSKQEEVRNMEQWNASLDVHSVLQRHKGKLFVSNF